MITKSGRSGCWQLGLVSSVTVGSTLIFGANCTLAQITPDGTLGAESSRVTPEVEVRGLPADLIEGGAARGGNLFHSFTDFNVEEFQRVYFANPVGIENILSRVTGANPSNILGTLGVDGAANLYLLNPNGIMFGANAQLDIEGSFVASTANSLGFGDGSSFSATNPEDSSLLTVSVPLGLQYGVNPAGEIANAGNLTVGQDLTLSAETLDLQGQLFAGRDLTLEAQDTVRIRDSVDAPFIAAARGQLLVQGNEAVDIFALNHSDSGLFSGGDMVLRSTAQVGGDAHYWSGGSFRIEQLDGTAGDLYSPYDPIILADGDVSLGDYRGASLHILAGGSVTLGNVEITGTDSGDNTINPNNTDPFIASLATVPLSDGTTLTIDGSAKPTLDVRAGIDWTAFPQGVPGDTVIPVGSVTPTFTGATSADIIIGDIVIDAIGSDGGRVFLTNRYQNNSSTVGNITVGFINTRDFLGGGSVTIDSRGEIELTDVVYASALDLSLAGFPFPSNTYLGNGGDVTLLAEGDITFNPGADLLSQGLLGGNMTIKSEAGIFIQGGEVTSDSHTSAPNLTGGDIRVMAELLSLTNGALLSAATFGQSQGGVLEIETRQLKVRDGSQISTNTFGEGDGGTLTVEALELVELDDAGSWITTQTRGMGKGGDLEIRTEQLIARDGAEVSTITGKDAKGEGGSLRIVASELVGLEGSRITAQTLGQGKGGDLSIETEQLIVRSGARVSTITDGEGEGGSLTIVASDSVDLSGTWSFITVQTQGTADAGNLRLETEQLTVRDGRVFSFADDGNGGTLTVEASEWVELSGGSQIASQSGGKGNTGSLQIETQRLMIRDGARVLTGTLDEGKGSTLTVNASESVELTGTESRIAAQTTGIGDAGNLRVGTERLLVRDGAQISTNTFSEGKGGSLSVDASESVELAGTESLIGAQTTGTGDAGDLRVETEQLLVRDGAQVSTNTFGEGRGGSLTVDASESVELAGTESLIAAQTTGIGDAGDLSVETQRLTARDGAVVSTSTFGEGKGGTLTVDASESVELIGEDSGIVAQTEGRGDAGDLRLETQRLTARNGAIVSTNTFGEGKGGALTVDASELIELSNESAIGSQTDGTGDAGDLAIATEQLTIRDRSLVSSDAFGSGTGGDVVVQASVVSLINDAQMSAGTFGIGRAGNIFVQEAESVLLEENSSISTEVNAGAIGRGGDVDIQTDSLSLEGNSEISAQSQGEGNAGNIALNVSDRLTATDSDIITATTQSAGGAIDITAQDIRLRGDSDITTSVFSGADNGGNITITTDSLIAFADSDILAFARDGRGGDITFNTPIFFGFAFRPAPKGTDPDTLDNNNRVDINASGAVDGVITLPNLDFIQNSLTELPENLIDTDSLLANSCIVRTGEQEGQFIITGAGNLPTRPSDASASPYPTGEVRTVPSESTSRPWQKGDPIVEPTGVYQLPNGRLVMARECS